MSTVKNSFLNNWKAHGNLFFLLPLSYNVLAGSGAAMFLIISTLLLAQCCNIKIINNSICRMTIRLCHNSVIEIQIH